MLSDNAIIFEANIKKVQIFADSIRSMGKNMDDVFQDVLKIKESVSQKIKELPDNRIGKKMLIEAIYQNANSEIEKIIASLENYLVYFQTINNCKYISNLDNITENEIDTLVDSLIDCLKKVRGSETIHYQDEEAAVNLLYKTVYSVMKYEFKLKRTSKLFNYLNVYSTDKTFISSLILEDIEKLKNDNAANLSKLSKYFYKSVNNNFSEDLYFNEELIRELAYFKENSLLENKTREEIMKISEEYTKNTTQIESTKHKINEINKDVDNNKKVLYNYKKGLNKSITKRILSFILAASLAVAPLGGLYFLARTKKIKKITTSYNITSMSDGDSSSEYVDIDPLTSVVYDRLYVKLSNPYEKDGSQYRQDYWIYDLNYEDYDEMSLEDIAKSLNIEKINVSLNESEKQTLYKKSLNYEDLIGKTTYELVKIDNIPEDYKYVLYTENILVIILIGIFVLPFIYCVIYGGLSIIYGDLIYWFDNNKDNIDGYKDYIKGRNNKIKELLANKEELIKKMYYLLDTNAEIKKRYEEMMKDPAIMEIVSKIGNSIDLSLMNEEEKISKGKKRVLEK